MEEEAWRILVAQQAAQSYLIGWLLRFSFMREKPEEIREIAKYIKEQARLLPANTVRATRQDDALHPDLAHISVKLHEYVDSLVDHAANETIEAFGVP